MSSPKAVQVIYGVLDGAHFFTGADSFSQGLCVAHMDLKKAFNEVSVQLKNLAEVNHQVQAEFVLSTSFEEFVSYLKHSPPISKSRHHARTRLD